MKSAYLKRLCIPVCNLLHRRHLVESIGQGLKLLDAVGESNGEFLGKEL